jgi:putative selenate reductase molybdopterin-binding subunit
VQKDGTMTAQDMYALSDTGAYGGHGLTVLGNTGHKTLPIYNTPAVRFYGDTVYTTTPRSGAYRGYGVTQGVIATETLITKCQYHGNVTPGIPACKKIIARIPSTSVTKLEQGARKQWA